MSDAHFDNNHVPGLLAVSNSDGSTPVTLYADPVTHRLLVTGTANTFIYNEVVSGSGTSFTLAHTPVTGLYAVYGAGQRLKPGAGNDFTISGAVLTMANTWAAGDILADYQY